MNSEAPRRAPHPVWALFANGSANEVSLVLTATDESSELVLEPVGLSDRELINSAEKAMRGAFYALKERKALSQTTYGFAYGFKGKGQFVNTSAGLALALALIHWLEEMPFAVAATGEINDHSPQAPIEPVDKINRKIEIGLKQLNAGDILLYPSANQEVDPQLKKSAAEKKIRLAPVQTIAEAVQYLIEFHNRNNRQTESETVPSPHSLHGRPVRRLAFPKWIIGVALCLSLLLVAIFFYPQHIKRLIGYKTSDRLASPITLRINMSGNDDAVKVLIVKTLFEELVVPHHPLRYVLGSNKKDDETDCTATISGTTLLKEKTFFAKNETADSGPHYLVNSKVSLSIKNLSIGFPNADNETVRLGNFTLKSEMDFETPDVLDRTLAHLNHDLLIACCTLMKSHIENKYMAKIITIRSHF